MAVSAGPPGSSRGGTAGGPTVCAQCAEVLIKMPGCGHPPALRPLLSWSLGWLLEGPWSPEGELGPSCSSWAPCKARALRDVAQSRRHARSARHTAPATPGPGPQPSAGQRLRGARERPHFHASTVFTLSQLCPQRGPRAAPRFADVTSVLFKARRSGAATALTERCPPTASPASCSCPRQPLLSPSPALVPSSLPFSGLPVCTLGKGGVAVCGLCIWLHSAVASPVPGTIRGEQVPTLAVCSRGPSAFPLSRRVLPRTSARGSRGTAAPSAPGSVRRSPRRWPTHGVTSLLTVHVHAGRPPPVPGVWGAPPVISDGQHLSTCLLPICGSSLEKFPPGPLPSFVRWL